MKIVSFFKQETTLTYCARMLHFIGFCLQLLIPLKLIFIFLLQKQIVINCHKLVVSCIDAPFAIE